jgi:hypothetical protein
MVSNPSKTRAIAKVVTDEVGARILAQLLAADFRRRSGYLMSAPAHCGGR